MATTKASVISATIAGISAAIAGLMTAAMLDNASAMMMADNICSNQLPPLGANGAACTPGVDNDVGCKIKPGPDASDSNVCKYSCQGKPAVWTYQSGPQADCDKLLNKRGNPSTTTIDSSETSDNPETF